MPALRIAMRQIREVLRLKDECALTYSQIARSLRISKGSVANYLRHAEAAGLTHEEAARLSPQRRLAPKFAAPDFALVHRELRRKGVTLTLLWEEYREAAQGVPYSRSRFFERYQDFVRALRRSMRQTHVAGEKLFVDYAGPTVPVIDAASGEERRAHVFVAVWGASNFTYAEATWSETKLDWISAHVNAFAYAGGVPALLVPDNPKALPTATSRNRTAPIRRSPSITAAPPYCRRGHANPATRPRSRPECCWSNAGSSLGCGIGASSASPNSTPRSVSCWRI